MASTTALFTGLTGLNANARNLDVIGNNIANVNTTAYKSSRLLFSSMFSRTLSEGTPPGDVTGGTNPFQIGLGVGIAGTQRNMTGGTISATGDSRDTAIDGAGFFVVQRGESQLYTRAGAFRKNANAELTDISGNVLLGYGVDEEFNVIRGALTPLQVPLGQLTIAEATRNVRMAGNLNANGPLPTAGSLIALGESATSGLRTVPGAIPPPIPGNLIETTTRLVDLQDPQASVPGTPLFAAGQTFLAKNVDKGGRLLPDATLPVTATTTVQELATFLQQALGIDTTVGNNPDGRTPGVAIDTVSGFINVVGNAGSANDIAIDSADVRLVASDGTVARYPFTPNKTATADGESVRTTFIVFDSLGTPVQVDLTTALVSRTSAGTTWRYYLESGDAAGVSLQVGTGTLSFDNEGQLNTTLPATVTINREASGAVTPLTFSLAFGDEDNSFTALTDVSSEIAATFRDGAPIGTLSSYGVGVDGTIVGSFSNGLVRSLGQVALATFSNPEGLVDRGGNLFAVGANSGTPIVSQPGTFGAGQIVAGSLELSNVDIGEEFIKLILSSTGYSASSRVIRTADELMQQLLVLGR